MVHEHVGTTGRLAGLDLLRLFVRSRELDRRESILVRQGLGKIQLPAAGHEPLAVLADALGEHDLLFCYYRDRPLLLARGVTAEQWAHNFFATAESSSQGCNDPGLHTQRELGIFSITGPTGMQCLPAVGAAWGMQRQGSPGVVLCTIGDAATREGEFFEALAFAVQLRLPVIFVVEDNGYGISTPTADMLPLRLNLLDHRWVIRVDGRDVERLREQGVRAIERSRLGNGPVVLWCELDRLDSHTSSDDHRAYRTEDQIAEMQDRDPLRRYVDHLAQRRQLGPGQLDQIQEQIRSEVDALYAAARRAAPPDPQRCAAQVLGPAATPPPMPVEPPEQPPTMVEAVNLALRAGLQADPRVLLFGQDIEDPKGGVFGFTRGLSTRFAGRVINAPVAEATMVGAGVGLAATGHRPVVELQFIDFATPAFHQIAHQAAMLRWRSQGDWTCPLVMYAPYGAYVHSGVWHSASNDGWWCHMPGLRVAVPSTPADAAGLLWTALHLDDPSLVLLPKNLARHRVAVDAYRPVPFGRAAVRRAGDDVTVVSWGNCVDLALRAAEDLAHEGVRVEVLDLVSLVPCDWETVLGSLQRTGRLVVVHEDSKTCGFGQAVLGELLTRTAGFFALRNPPQLVARPDVPIGFAPVLERAALPSAEQVRAAVLETLK